MRRALLLVLPLLLTACSSGTPKPVPSGIEGVRVLSEDPSHDHVEGPQRYDETPPLGGPHNARWLRCEVYDAPVPPEFAVHSMEHGGVWLTHRPGVDAAPLAALRELTGTTREYVLVSPVPDLPSAVVAATWGASLAVDGPDDPRLEQFVRTYAGGGQGGEKGAPCTSSEAAVTPQEARRLLGTGTTTAATPTRVSAAAG